MKADEAQRLQNFLYDRLYNSARNNVGYKCNAEDVFMDIADNRLKTWLHDFYNEEAHTVLKQPRFLIHSDGRIEQIVEYCDDYISRQQAIDKMQELEDEDIEMFGCSIPEGFDGKRAIVALKTLPSIQPKTDFEHKAEIVISQLRADRDRLQEAIEKISAEITAISISGQVDEHTMFVRSAEQVKQMALEIIDKYKAESEGEY